MDDLMDDFVSLSSDSYSDLSLPGELDLRNPRDNGADERGTVDIREDSREDGDETANKSDHGDPRQTRLRRHRESMARLRQDRRNRIKIFEMQEQSLQQKLFRMLAWMDLHRPAHEAMSCQRLVYSDLVRAAESLMSQRYALEEELLQWQRYLKFLTAESQRIEDEATSIALQIQTEARSPRIEDSATIHGFWVRLQDAEAPFYCERVLPETCASAITKALEMIASTRRRLATIVVTDVCVGDCLGWKTEWHIDDASAESDLGPMLHFRYTRITRLRTSLDDLLDKTWAVLASQDQSAHLYGSTVVAKHVQKISDDAFIEVRNLPVRENHCLLRYFNLVSRMCTVDEASVAIVTLALNKQPRQSQLEASHCNDHADGIVWIRHNTAALQLSHVDDDTVEIEYVGAIECLDRRHAEFLVIDCCASLLRWERLVFE